MKIILKEDIVNLGFKNDVVEVKNGYGRNYLIPQGKAILATPSALKIHAENLRQQAHKLAKVKADAEEAAKAFEGVALTIPVKVSPTGCRLRRSSPVFPRRHRCGHKSCRCGFRHKQCPCRPPVRYSH